MALIAYPQGRACGKIKHFAKTGRKREKKEFK
jgi:hypothetical protein